MDFEGRARVHSHLDIAPLIDIVFLLLVFFMLTSTFLVPEAIELELPESRSAQAVEDVTLTVALDQAGEVYLNGEAVGLDGLGAALTPLLEKDPDTPVILKSDARSAVQQLLEVMDAIRAAGGTNIALATLRPEVTP